MLLVGIITACLWGNAQTAEISAFINSVKLPKNNALENNQNQNLVRLSESELALVYFLDQGSKSQIFFTLSRNNGKNFTQPILISEGQLGASLPNMVVTQDGNNGKQIFIFWVDAGQIYYRSSRDMGLTFGSTLKISGKYINARYASLALDGDQRIHMVFEDSGQIYYRYLSGRQSDTWSEIFILSEKGKSSSLPVIAIDRNKKLMGVWLTEGNLVFRTQDLGTSLWSESQVLANINKNSAATNPLLISDLSGNFHLFWNQETLLRHKVYAGSSNIWKKEYQLSMTAMPWFGGLTATLDRSGLLHAMWIENGKLVYSTYQTGVESWSGVVVLEELSNGSFISNPKLGTIGGNNYENFIPQSGYDLSWISKTNFGDNTYQFNYYSSRSGVGLNPNGNVPSIYKAEINGGNPLLSWKSSVKHTAFRIVIDRENPPQAPYDFDSGQIQGSQVNYWAKQFDASAGPYDYYAQVKVLDENSNWTDWSEPYLVSYRKDKSAPLIEITAIETNSLFLYSPNPKTLYYGSGIERPKTFTIKGTILDEGTGVKEIRFPEILGDAPAPIINPKTRNWSVEYTIQSSDRPGDLVITAVDKFGNSSAQVIKIIKDFTPPQPPQWVRVFADLKKQEIADPNKNSSKKEVYVTWTDGMDEGSGIRYHLMGINPTWHKNNIHSSGDSELGIEGANTFYVFAIDNVGNISAPGTDTIFIDTLPPGQPKIETTATSKNIIYGTLSPDTVEVFANDTIQGIKIVRPVGVGRDQHLQDAPVTFEFDHQLLPGSKQVFKFVAKDALGHMSAPANYLIEYDTTPPKIDQIVHSAVEPLRAYDTLVVTLTGEPGNSAVFKIKDYPGKSEPEVKLYDDGTNGDLVAGDGQYTGKFFINELNIQGSYKVMGTLIDRAGNAVTEIALLPVKIDSIAPVMIDDFELSGRQYPFENFVKAENINAFPEIQAPAQTGTGVVKINYDFAKKQTVAALTSREMPAKNFSGPSPVLKFWLRGSNTQKTKLFIKLRSARDKEWTKNLMTPYVDSKEISLVNSTWHQVEIPLSSVEKDNLNDIIQYALIFKTEDPNEKGEIYIDSLRLEYFPIKAPAIERKYPTTTVKPDSFTAQNLNALMNDFPPAAYLSPELYPALPLPGDLLTVKVKIPKELDPAQAAVLLGKNKYGLVSSALAPAGGDYWKANIKLPLDLKTGVQFAYLFVKTKDGRHYKTKFPYEVARKNMNAQENVFYNFYPHPVIAGKPVDVKIKIQTILKAASLYLVFGEDENSLNSIPLSKASSDKDFEIWKGQYNIPNNQKEGDYKATLLIKSLDGKIYKKPLTYSVIAE